MEKFIVAFVVLFLINPLGGIIATSFYACLKKNSNGIKLLMILCMMYLCALNTTKVEENDMIRYIAHFEDVPYNGYLGTLVAFNHSAAGGVKDAAYGTLVFLSYYLTAGNQSLFIFIVTFLGYWLMFMTIYKFGKEYKLPNYMIVTQVLVLSFFTQYFSMTFHLIRQVLGACIFFYALTFKETSFKKYLLLCILAIATHSSVAFIVAFSFVPMMKRRLKLKEIGALAIFAAFSVIILSSFAIFVLDTVELEGSLEYSLGRVAQMEGAEDSTKGLQIIGVILTLISLVLCMLEREMGKKMLYPIIINLALLMSFMIFGLTTSPLLQYRFFFYMYSFLPFIYITLVRRYKGMAKPICFVTIVFLIVRFYLTYDKVFEYAPIDEAILNPYPLLIKFG